MYHTSIRKLTKALNTDTSRCVSLAGAVCGVISEQRDGSDSGDSLSAAGMAGVAELEGSPWDCGCVGSCSCVRGVLPGGNGSGFVRKGSFGFFPLSKRGSRTCSFSNSHR